MTDRPHVTPERTTGLVRSWPLLCRCATWPVLVTVACGPLALAGCVGAAYWSWLPALVVGAAGVTVSAGVALLFAVSGGMGRGRAAVLAACVLAGWWALAAVVVLPLVSPWGLLAAGLAGLAGLVIVLARTGRRLRECRDAWRLVAAFVAEPRRYQLAVLHTAGDEELCRMWNEAGRGMRRVNRPTVLSEYLDLRRLVLEELEGRNPAAFGRWLDNADASHIQDYLVHRTG